MSASNEHQLERLAFGENWDIDGLIELTQKAKHLQEQTSKLIAELSDKWEGKAAESAIQMLKKRDAELKSLSTLCDDVLTEVTGSNSMMCGATMGANTERRTQAESLLNGLPGLLPPWLHTQVNAGQTVEYRGMTVTRENGALPILAAQANSEREHAAGRALGQMDVTIARLSGNLGNLVTRHREALKDGDESGDGASTDPGEPGGPAFETGPEVGPGGDSGPGGGFGPGVGVGPGMTPGAGTGSPGGGVPGGGFPGGGSPGGGFPGGGGGAPGGGAPSAPSVPGAPGTSPGGGGDGGEGRWTLPGGPGSWPTPGGGDGEVSIPRFAPGEGQDPIGGTDPEGSLPEYSTLPGSTGVDSDLDGSTNRPGTGLLGGAGAGGALAAGSTAARGSGSLVPGSGGSGPGVGAFAGRSGGLIGGIGTGSPSGTDAGGAGGSSGAGGPAAGRPGVGAGAGGRPVGMMTGPMGGGSNSRSQRGGGLGYIAPHLEDEGERGPASDISRAGARPDPDEQLPVE